MDHDNFKSKISRPTYMLTVACRDYNGTEFYPGLKRLYV